MATPIQIDVNLQAAANSAIESVMAEVSNVKAVLISTADGFEVASKAENSTLTSRLSAMAGSFSALGTLVGDESQLGECKNVMVEATEGSILIFQIPHPRQAMTMCVIAGNDCVMGQVLYFAKQAVLSMTATN